MMEFTKDNVKSEYRETNVPDKITDDDVKMYDKINDIYIYHCKKDDTKDYIIKGITQDDVKAVYNTLTNKWYYGTDTSKAYLIPMSVRPKEEIKEIQAKGVQSATRARTEKKNLQELAKSMLEQTASEKMIKAVLGDQTETMMDCSYGSLLLAKGLLSALEGSFKWAEFVRDTSGQRPKNEMEISADIITESDKALLDKLTEKIG